MKDGKSGKFGSSPRVRGTRRHPAIVKARLRFIPACAGNTCTRGAPRRRISVHPRVCGEHARVPKVVTASRGSSPRVRGTRTTCGDGVAPSRFIPACAGNTAAGFSAPGEATVHPRVCGEHIRDGRACVFFRRFIPACAGNTRARSMAPTCCSVHPRVCGEHAQAARENNPAGGSSPRVRGTRRGNPRLQALPRFIPACAGNTQMRTIVCSPRPVHPRVCGEHSSQRCLI